VRSRRGSLARQASQGVALSVEVEVWTREDGDLAALLPRAAEWDVGDDFFEFEGDGWLLAVSAPEGIDVGDVPPELDSLAAGLRYRIELSVEPSAPAPAAWEFARDVMESVGRALGGVGLDPESGHPRSWAD
jgi:hypothetical protein